MTTKTKKTILFASLVATLAFALVQISDVEATNVNGSWTHNDVEFLCTVSGLTKTSNVNECGDISTSTNALEHGALTITSVSSGHDIVVYAWTNCSCAVGRASTTYNASDEITYAYNVLNKNLSWEDANVDTTTDGYDWQTATAHEMGHNVGLAHYTNNVYLMYDTLPINDADRNLTAHSIDHIEDEYP